MTDSSIKKLEQDLRALTRDVKTLKDFLGVQEWLSPGDAAKILPINRNQIIDLIYSSEQAIVANKTPRLKRNRDYFNASQEGKRPTWKVNVARIRNAIDLE